jgi:hypothetical protein
MARRKGAAWYVAIINGTDADKTITIDWSRLKSKAKQVKVYADSGNPAEPWNVYETSILPQRVDLKARGGCVMILR